MELAQGFIQFDQRQLFLATAGTTNSVNKNSALLILPAFGDEMNKSRHLTRQLLQALAKQGLAGFSLDAWGTGDSDGSLDQVTVDIWQQDLRNMVQLLAEAGYCELKVVAIRFGALLLWDLLQHSLALPVTKVVLWQPYWQSQVFLQQFFRLKVAEQMATGSKTSQKELEQQLNSGDIVEIGGYPVTADFISSIRNLAPVDILPAGKFSAPMLWLETALNEQVSPAVQKTISKTCSQLDLTYHQLQGPTWWNAAELIAMPQLIAQSVDFLIEPKT